MKPTQSRPALSRAAIVQAALDVLEENGAAAVSMRAVAGRLGCEAMSLYRHVANKAELLDLACNTIVREIGVPDRDGADWEQRLRTVLREIRRVALRHPAAFELIARQPLTGLGTKPIEAGMLALVDAGLGAEEAARALCNLLAFTTGVITNELAARNSAGLVPEIIDLEQPAPPPGAYARYFIHLMQHTTYETEFEFGLDLLIRGLGIPTQQTNRR